MFDHSLINISDTISTPNPAHFANGSNSNIINIEDPQFTDAANNNYIQGLTAAEDNQGDPNITNAPPIITLDILGNMRIQSTGPDMGPYEVK